MDEPRRIYLFEGDLPTIERKLDSLMALVDDLTAKFDALDTAVRGLLTREGAAMDALEAEIATLRADDAVEDSKLTGLTAAAEDLRGAVEAFGAQSTG